jgi:DNA processing protein
LARGCHALIRQGAKLVENADDIISELAPLTGHLLDSAAPASEQESPVLPVDDDYKDLLAILNHDPATIDDLAQRSSLTIDQLSSMLLILELHGEVESLSGGRYALSG